MLQCPHLNIFVNWSPLCLSTQDVKVESGKATALCTGGDCG